jgi:hypothetical protein
MSPPAYSKKIGCVLSMFQAQVLKRECRQHKTICIYQLTANAFNNSISDVTHKYSEMLPVMQLESFNFQCYLHINYIIVVCVEEIIILDV